MDYSVVIPTFNHWELTHSLLLDIYKLFPPKIEIIVVDDCSTDEEVSSGLSWWKSAMLKEQLHVFRNETNSGFLRTANFGVSKASGDIVILISNDVIIKEENILTKVKEALTDQDAPTLVGARLLSGDTGWNTFNGVTYPYLEGWFLAFKKAEWDKIGGLDERFCPYDFEDIDLSTKCIATGGKLVCLDIDVVHLGAQTTKYSPERELQTKINQEKFRQKWTTNLKS
jgi:GT2 family glycosyltransferase